jgi:hypothetical protein
MSSSSSSCNFYPSPYLPWLYRRINVLVVLSGGSKQTDYDEDRVPNVVSGAYRHLVPLYMRSVWESTMVFLPQLCAWHGVA